MKNSSEAPKGVPDFFSSLFNTLIHIDYIKLGTTLSLPLVELWRGALADTVPWDRCFAAGIIGGTLVLTHLDQAVFHKIGLSALYPRSPYFYWPYTFCVLTLGFWSWAWFETVLRQKLLKRLTDVFVSVGLKNQLGHLPRFIFDRPVDEFTRKMRLNRAGFSLSQFTKAKPGLESSLQVYIDEIREKRETGTIDIIYAHSPMPTLAQLERVQTIGPTRFMVGKTRAKPIFASLRDVPHLMIAGQTGGGKSTFLRELIVTLFLNNGDMEFTLIDLKGGLEFQTFENLKRVQVTPNVERAVSALTRAQGMLTSRMALLKEYQCKDIDALAALKTKAQKEDDGKAALKIPSLHRHVFVIDEAAEMFLAGSHAKVSEIQAARNIISQIARQGRSVGVHLVIATQRPDSRALDPQVKANLTGVLCFQMQNDASSIAVLGVGRATELPPIPGRAIWKAGADMMEIQVPYLSTEEADELLKGHRISNEEPQKEMPQVEQAAIQPLNLGQAKKVEAFPSTGIQEVVQL